MVVFIYFVKFLVELDSDQRVGLFFYTDLADWRGKNWLIDESVNQWIGECEQNIKMLFAYRTGCCKRKSALRISRKTLIGTSIDWNQSRSCFLKLDDCQSYFVFWPSFLFVCTFDFWSANLLFCPFSFIVHNCLQYFCSLLCSAFILVLDSRKWCISDHNFVIISTKSLKKCIILKNREKVCISFS